MERGIGFSSGDKKNTKKTARNFLFAIGIDTYHHWSPLNNAVKDVRDIANVLVQQYQFQEEDVHLITNEEATEANIYKRIRELKREIEPEDNLVFLYSGHGHYDKEFDEGYWIPVDARKDSEDRYISNSNIIKRVNAIHTHHTLLIVDSCFSGTLVVQKRSGMVDEAFKSRRILSSGRQETVADGRPGENSPFAAGIITYLKKNTEKAINTTSMVQYVKNYVHGKAKQTPVEGRIQNSDDEGGEFIFHLKMTEIALWQQVEQGGQASDYENYLDYFPEGQYAPVAQRKILALKEEDIWQSALLKDNELAYQNYIQKYLNTGKYLAEANKRLNEIRLNQAERKEMLEELAQKDAERDRIAAQFKTLIQEAELCYNEKKLKEAREKYRESQQFHMPGFVPSYEYIEEQINLCHSGMKFLEYYELGRQAMNSQNFRLALQYFSEALKVDDNPKVEEFVRHCRQKLLIQQKRSSAAPKTTRPTTSEPYQAAPQVRIQPAPKKKSNTLWWVLGGFVGLVLIAAVINNLSTYDGDVNIDGPSTIWEGGESGGEGLTPPAAPTYNQLIIGTWRLTDMTSNGQSASDLYPGMVEYYNATYTFNSNGTVQGFSTTGSDFNNYSIAGNSIVIQSPLFGTNTQGFIQQLDKYELIISYSFYNPNTGTYMPMVMEYERVQ